MRKSCVASLAVALALAAPVSAAAGTLSTGFIYWHDDSAKTTCNVTNVGSKPITITSVSFLDDDSTELVPLAEGCTQAPLAPGTTCFWNGDVETLGGKLEFKGGAKSLRGRCLLLSSINGEVLGPGVDLR